MKKLIIIICLFSQTCFAQKKDYNNFIFKSSQILKACKSLSYQAEYKIKYFDNSDTIIFPKLNYTILKQVNDTILNYLIKVNLIDLNQERVYDGNTFYYILKQDKIIEEFDLKTFGSNFIKNNIYKQGIPLFLTSEKTFDNYFKSSESIKFTEINDGYINALKVEFIFPTNKEVTFLKRIIYFNKSTNLPYRLEGFSKYMDLQDEYFSLNISNLKLNTNLNDDVFKLDKNLKGYTKKTISNDLKNNNIPSLNEISNLIEFEGSNLWGEKIKIDNTFYENQLVLLDFWYLGCEPCLKAMPKLNELQNKYSTKKLTVLGVNPFDSLEEKNNIIKKFLEKLNVNYNSIFVKKEVTDEYNIKNFPTMLLFKNGKLIYSKIGFNEDGINELEEIIKNNVN